MRINQTLSDASALVMLAVTLGVAIGEPPPKEPPQPGLTGSGTVVLAANGTNGDIHLGSPRQRPTNLEVPVLGRLATLATVAALITSVAVPASNSYVWPVGPGSASKPVPSDDAAQQQDGQPGIAAHTASSAFTSILAQNAPPIIRD